MTLGLAHGHNVLKKHESRWKTLFEEERARLTDLLGNKIIDIQHIGSTCIPNIQAKPIIDIAIGVQEYTLADSIQEEMASIGYDYPGDIGIPEHRIFGRDPNKRKFLVHIIKYQGTNWNNLIAFRDKLLKEPTLALQYEAVKIKAINQYPTGRAEYTDFKSQFVEQALKNLT